MISVVIPVYRDAVNALALADSLSQQLLPNDWSSEIILVDDGSDDGTVDTLRGYERGNLRILALKENRGRARARNAGANQARGEFLVFIDCDCRPVGDDFLAAHLRMLLVRSIASCGHVVGDGNGFWSRYQEEASARRVRQHARGVTCAGSSQNFAVRRQAFMQIGGFDTRYREYGFEDRDLLVRLSGLGKIGWCIGAQVQHLDKLTLEGVLSKMQQAASESAALFSHDHPAVYGALGYGVIDTRLHHWLRPIAAASGPLLKNAAAIDRLLDRSWMPYPVGKMIVKALSALAFAHGSVENWS